jgi:hypothetical protein
MPRSPEILESLSQIAKGGFAVAVGWHLVVAVALVAALWGWRPLRRTAAALLAAPLASVSAFAWAYGSPFNGLAFALLTALLVVLALRAPDGAVTRGRSWTALLGALLIAFAWVYPHFLDGRSPLASLYGAPMGLIPCPSLALVLGFTLLASSPGGRATSIALGISGLFYGLFGALRLGVWIDLPLVVGAAGLLLSVYRPGIARTPAPSAHS